MLIKLTFALAILMILVGGDRGVKSFCTLILNVLTGYLSIRLITAGVHPLLVMCISSIIFVFLTIGYQNGFHAKTIASIFAVVTILLLCCIIIYCFCYHVHIAGFNEIELQEEDISYLSAGTDFRMFYVLMMSMIWCQLGAIGDTSIAISSALNEIYLHTPVVTTRQLFHEGMIIGRDILGTTINTLTFVFLGESIMVFIYYRTYQYSIQQLLNSSSFIQSIFAVLLPCIGCILIIPWTVLVYGAMIKSPRFGSPKTNV